MKLHKEGNNTILITAIIALTAAAISYITISDKGLILALLPIILMPVLFVTYFFRYPARVPRTLEGTVLAPCDGKVVAIEEVEEQEFLNTRCIQLSIFMSPLNVHVNWYPVSGIVRYMRYHPGKFLVAFHPKSSELNERTTVVLEDNKGNLLLLRQIAGAMARRIVCYARENERVTQGGQMGFIKFGSRVDIFVPTGAAIRVKLGDRVKGNITRLADL